MGGVGSGNWYRRFDAKTTMDRCHGLDVRNLYREGFLEPGACFRSSWSRAGRETGSICGFVDRYQVILSYRYRPAGGGWEDVAEAVSLSWTPCNFGGERPWFICPGAGCWRGVAILYGAGKYFLCRHCYDLRYGSQREDKKDRALRRVQKIRMRLGGSASMTEPFPKRPKGMHRDTYMRLFWEYDEAESEHLAGAREWLGNLQRHIS